MGPQYLIDSNAVIDYLSGKFPAEGMVFMNEVVDLTPKISVITKIEVLGYNAPPKDYQLLIEFMQDAHVLDLNEAIVNRTIELRKEYKIKLPDAIIAATALVNGLGLISRNSADFKDIKELYVLDLHLPVARSGGDS